MRDRRSEVELVGFVAVLFASGCIGPQRNVKLDTHAQSKDGTSVVSFSTPADLRLAFLREGKAAVQYCAEPMPDVALGSDASGSGSASAAYQASQALSASTTAALSAENETLRKELQDAIASYENATQSRYSRSNSASTSASTSASGSANLQAAARLAVTVAELGGRSQQVLLAREFLYRLCEAAANGHIEKGHDYVTLQVNALRLIQSISRPVTKSATAENAELLQRIAEYTKSQTELCAARAKACTEAAGKDEAAKTACAKANKECLEAIKPPAPPKAERSSDESPKALGVDGLRDPSELVIPPAKESRSVQPNAPKAVAPSIAPAAPATPEPSKSAASSESEVAPASSKKN